MERTFHCPNPRCRGGAVPTDPSRAAPPRRRAARVEACPVCNGTGFVDERASDLWQAGIVVAGATDEDFRSSPTSS